MKTNASSSTSPTTPALVKTEIPDIISPLQKREERRRALLELGNQVKERVGKKAVFLAKAFMIQGEIAQATKDQTDSSENMNTAKGRLDAATTVLDGVKELKEKKENDLKALKDGVSQFSHSPLFPSPSSSFPSLNQHVSLPLPRALSLYIHHWQQIAMKVSEIESANEELEHIAKAKDFDDEITELTEANKKIGGESVSTYMTPRDEIWGWLCVPAFATQYQQKRIEWRSTSWRTDWSRRRME